MSAEALSPLKDRITLFFKTQPSGAVLGRGELDAELPADDLKDLVPGELAESFAKKAEKEGVKTEGLKRAELQDMGRLIAVRDALDGLKKDGVLAGCKMEGAGMGWRYIGPRDEPEPKVKLKRLPIDQIRVDKGVQPREGGINPRIVQEYSEVHDRLPPVRVFHFKNDKKEDVYLLSRGFHRIEAKRLAGQDMIECEVIEGDREAAILDAVADNASHGLRRTPDDVRNSIAKLLGMRQYKNASVAWLANQVKCSWAFAAKAARAYRKAKEQEREARGEKPDDDDGNVVGADGKVYPKSIKRKGETEGGPPAADVAPAAPPLPSTGVKDRTGAEITDPDVARAFIDTRFYDALRTILKQVQYVRNFRMEGAAVNALTVGEREECLGAVERNVGTLELGGMWAQTPADADKTEFAAARRRKWMTKAEYTAYEKTKGRRKPAAPPSPGETVAPPQEAPAHAAA